MVSFNLLVLMIGGAPDDNSAIGNLRVVDGSSELRWKDGIVNEKCKGGRDQLERILGLGRIGTTRNLPGTVDVPGREFRYISWPDDRSSDDLSLLFKKVVRAVDPPHAQGGGVINENCVLVVPSGECLFGLSYKGDLAGWRTQIKEGAERLSLQVAWIVGDRLRVDDGGEVSLAECSVRFLERDSSS